MRPELVKQLLQVLAELEMCSHVSAAQPAGSKSADEDVGGKRPPGGIDRKEDRQPHERDAKEPERLLRSADHFRRQMQRGRPVRRVLEDAQASLAAWKRQPKPKDPAVSSALWKRLISEATESHGVLATRYGVTRAYIQQIRKQYGDSRPEAA